MPPLAALGAAAVTAATTAGAAAMTAIGGLTLSGLATGAAVISAGTGILSKITGSKTLGKVSMGFGIASGVGFAGSGIAAMSATRSATGAAAEGGLLSSGGSDLLKTSLKGSKAAESGFKSFNASGATSNAADSFAKNASNIGSKAPVFDPQLEKSFFERANDTLTKYNPMLNLAAGAAQGYMQSEQMQLQKDMLDKRLNIDQQLIDRTNVNNGTPLNFDARFNLERTENPFPLLRR